MSTMEVELGVLEGDPEGDGGPAGELTGELTGEDHVSVTRHTAWHRMWLVALYNIMPIPMSSICNPVCNLDLGCHSPSSPQTTHL